MNVYAHSVVSRITGALAIVIAVLVFVAGARAQAGAETPQALLDAHRAYYEGQYEQALASYQHLADDGNAEAAERAGFMLLQGEGLYGEQVHRDVDQARARLLEAARRGRRGAEFMLGMIDSTD